ncbi:MAG: DUF2490 domain-containing protein [Saprospiraceae bacterium]|nr:DUF2490 domain-containing protein [Saprospiraceae bacterium]HMW39658.1 DUF2490 domain-containing protein [Saprospiraceae bacterium]HMX88331.1 DUF2490 domain-containing protein [Saprospiraceae bacterium]HMZ40385.1 DUF2490 domain-containing protein [Saprospiraceae bacterium]HNA65148.1 DUF2490 domain-containing protein [Saprospiraceae bacterium]
MQKKDFDIIILITFFFILLTLTLNQVNAQNTRLNTYQKIGWYNYFGTFRISPKFGIHTEYQFRRTQYFTEWQQSLLRVGLNYQPNARLQLRIGYAWAETFPYSDIPINALGKQFTEHRIFQMATLHDKISHIELSHRWMLEQRWIGRYSDPGLTREDQYPLFNRVRYMFRLQFPLNLNHQSDNSIYFTAYDEILIGFGSNVGENVFDQNRIAFLLGYKPGKSTKIEAGFINQILQLGREVNNRNVFQYNSGLILNLILNITPKDKT